MLQLSLLQFLARQRFELLARASRPLVSVADDGIAKSIDRESETAFAESIFAFLFPNLLLRRRRPAGHFQYLQAPFRRLRNLPPLLGYLYAPMISRACLQH